MNNEFNLYPLITIIIPSYNHEKYIAQAIRSVFNQTYSCIELIIIDDGSSDGSSKIIEDEIKFFQSSGRKVLYKKNANQGLSKTLNEAINLASGEYICFLASDDAYLPDKLKCSFNLLNGTKSVVGAIYTDGYIVNEKGEILSKFSDKYPVPLLHNIHDELLIGNWIPALGLLYKRSVFENVGLFNENLKVEDYDFFLRLTQKYKVLRTSKCLFLYRMHGGSTSSNNLMMHDQVIATSEFHPKLKKLNKIRAALVRRDIIEVLRTIDFQSMILLFRLALRKFQARKGF